MGFIEETLDLFFNPKPYLVCNCDEFDRGEWDDTFNRYQCKNCRGWKTLHQMVMEK
jgi:hypothetical protein